MEAPRVSGAAFVSFNVRRQWLLDSLAAADSEKVPVEEKKLVVVDFSSPNIAKDMHVGHLRSTVIGDVVCRLFEFLGHRVLRRNHLGDWGTQFGMLISEMKRQGIGAKEVERMNVERMGQLYREAKMKFDRDPEFKTDAQREVVRLQKIPPDPETKEFWEQICRRSEMEFQKIYAELGIQLESRGESFYNPFLGQIVSQVCEEGLAEEDEGAILAFNQKFAFPLILQKGDGGYTYDTTDIAAIWHRLEVDKADQIFYVTDKGQKDHFLQIFDLAKRMNWLKDHHRVEHIGFGVVQREDGKKFKTREGTAVRLMDLLEEAVEKSKSFMQQRALDEEHENSQKKMSPGDLEKLAKKIGYGALKFFDLNHEIESDYRFSFRQMLDLKGKSAVYVLYSHVRLSSILQKASKFPVKSGVGFDIYSLDHPSELALAVQILKFPDAIEQFSEGLSPHILCGYALDLASKSNSFYRDCKVVLQPQSPFDLENRSTFVHQGRLQLVTTAKKTMETCLHILGIETVDFL